MESEGRLQEALTAGAVMAFDWEAGTGLSRRSANAAQILGFDTQQTSIATQFFDWIHPDDRAQFKSSLAVSEPTTRRMRSPFRFVRPDGREMWLEEIAKAEFDAAGRCVRIKGLTLDISERKRAEKHQGQLIAELDHRVKNVLARVAVVAMYTRQGSNSMDDFIQALDGRIQSMADAHALLSQSHWQGVSLTELVRRLLAPYATDANTTIEGPDVKLSAAATEAIAMVLQELVTNAAKYGSLSTPGGRVSVSWDRRPSGDATASLMIAWRELGGPTTAAPAKSGYGTSLIRDLVPHELGGSVDLVFAPHGVCCTIEIPARLTHDNEEESLTEAGLRAVNERIVARRRSLLTGFCRMVTTFFGVTGENRVAGDHDNRDASVMQPINQAGGQLPSPQMEVDQGQVRDLFGAQTVSLGSGRGRPGHLRSQELKQRLHCFADVPGILDQENTHTRSDHPMRRRDRERSMRSSAIPRQSRERLLCRSRLCGV
jgi:PAS domain S-box-containing protein